MKERGGTIYSIHNELKDKISELNDLIQDKYKSVLSLDRNEFRSFIKEYIGPIISMTKFGNRHLALYEAKGGIVGVDGSTNRMGGAYPHFVDVFQGLAKSTIIKNKPIIKVDIYSPLFSDMGKGILEEDKKIAADKRNEILASIEVKVALEAAKNIKPYAILMDGSLIRYNISSYELWMELREECEKDDILLIGVIKDIKTSIIGDKLGEIDHNMKIDSYDRELLFGQLDYGEMIVINDDVNKKNKEGYSSVFMRSSLAPNVIGMDIIDSQKNSIEEMGRLVFTLTPENSRGVPLWLDIVDKEVLISDAIMKGLMERYMDRDIYERFFISERAKRS